MIVSRYILDWHHQSVFMYSITHYFTSLCGLACALIINVDRGDLEQLLCHWLCQYWQKQMLGDLQFHHHHYHHHYHHHHHQPNLKEHEGCIFMSRSVWAKIAFRRRSPDFPAKDASFHSHHHHIQPHHHHHHHRHHHHPYIIIYDDLWWIIIYLINLPPHHHNSQSSFPFPSSSSSPSS